MAQTDNLGDIVIRREMLDWLLGSCDQVVVLRGDLPASYVAAFGRHDRITFVRSPLSFQAALLGAVVRPGSRPVLVFAPGPATLVDAPKPLLKACANLANVALVRIGRGAVFTVGRAVRGTASVARLIERSSARLQSLYVARDAVTRSIVGAEVVVAPDLAFARADRPTSTSGSTRNLVLSFRGDRVADDELVARSVVAATKLGLLPVLVTQVARDDPQHARLARDHGVEHVSWDGRDHATQIDRVTGIMTQADVVVSDRLHALILGARSGAVAVPVIHPGTDKLSTTLAVVPSATGPHATADVLRDCGLEPQVIDPAAAGSTLARVRALFEARVSEVDQRT